MPCDAIGDIPKIKIKFKVTQVVIIYIGLITLN
jgi:hypothetical protein